MNIKIIKNLIFFLMLSFSLFLLVNLGDSKVLAAGISDTPDKGVFVDIVKAIDEVYTEGSIKIIFYPLIDSWENVEYEKVDFHIPMTINPNVLIERKPFQYSSEKIGKVAMVIYSNTDKPITKKMLDAAVNNELYKGVTFPYKIESNYDFGFDLTYPTKDTKNIIQSMKKLGNKGIDAIIWVQEEGDMTLKKLKIESIHREHWIDFYDVIMVANTTRGDELNKILSSNLKKLIKSGKLNQLHSKLHSPYKEWQPSKMGW